MSLTLDDAGRPSLRCVADDLTLYDAMQLARSGQAASGELLFAGHPEQFALWLDTYTGEDSGWSASQRERFEGIVSVWLHEQRSLGSLRLSDVTAGQRLRDDCVDALPACLVDYLRPSAPPWVERADEAGLPDSASFLAQASAHSMLGLLRGRSDRHALLAWIRRIRGARTLARVTVPLFDCLDQTGLAARNLRFAAWWHGPWCLIGRHAVCPVHMVSVNAYGRLSARTCLTDGASAWSFEAMWSAWDRPVDPVFDVHRNEDALKPLDMPGPAGAMVASMLLHGIGPDTQSARPPASLLGDLVAALRESRFRLRCGLLASLESEPLAESQHMGHYHYLLGDGVAERRRNRAQAISIAPLLLDDLAGGRAPATRLAIDIGARLYPAIARDLGAPVWVARRLPVIGLQAWQAAGRNPQRAAQHIAGLIELCGPQAPHADLAALCALHQIWRAGRWLTTAGESSTRVIRRQLIQMAGKQAAQRGWESVQAIMGVSSIADGATQPLRVTCDPDAGNDWVEYLLWLLQVIELVNQAKRDATPPGRFGAMTMAALVELLRGLTLSDLPRLAQRWRAALAARDGAHLPVASETGPGDAAILLAPCTLPLSGFRIQQLLAAEDLHAEGTAMQHCAATYAARAARGHSLIVRMQHPQDGTRATLEFRHEPPPQGQWTLVQASAYRNDRPDKATLMAADECLQHLNDVSSRIDPNRLKPYILGTYQFDFDPYIDSVVAIMLEAESDHRFVPGAASGGMVRRLQQAFDVAAKPYSRETSALLKWGSR
jgi:hypothetical protein